LKCVVEIWTEVCVGRSYRLADTDIPMVSRFSWFNPPESWRCWLW